MLPAQLHRFPLTWPGAMCGGLVVWVCFLTRLGSRLFFRADSRDRINLIAPVELRACVGISACARHKGMVVGDEEYLMQLSLSQYVVSKTAYVVQKLLLFSLLLFFG